ncbi:glycosyltransferase family protein [Streptomyces nigra]|uniref:hypothetical protein n=1 Tax=Streptomyces nigra TaxID=1827580 RepID=UPI0036797CA3
MAPDFFASAAGTGSWRCHFDDHAPGRPPVLLSAGAWGAAQGMEATARILTASGFLPVALCGRNERLRLRMARVPGVLVLDWVSDMPGLMGAARVLVDNAAGQTAVQALAAGVPVVAHRPLPGHGEAGVRRMSGLGASMYAADDAELLDLVERLSRDGAERDRVIARGRALFREDALAHVVSAARTSAA